METVVEGFVFNDFCQQCQKVMGHRIEQEGKELMGVCTVCGAKRSITEPDQVFYPKTDLWVTRFRVGNTSSVVAGKLLDVVRQGKRS